MFEAFQSRIASHPRMGQRGRILALVYVLQTYVIMLHCRDREGEMDGWRNAGREVGMEGGKGKQKVNGMIIFKMH